MHLSKIMLILVLLHPAECWSYLSQYLGTTKTRPPRKMSRSWTSTKTELKEKKAAKSEDNHEEVEDVDKSVEAGHDNSKNLSSSSNDPGSSSNANTNSRYKI